MNHESLLINNNLPGILLSYFFVMAWAPGVLAQNEIIWEYGEPAKWQKLGFRLDMSSPDDSPVNQTPLSAILWKMHGFNNPEEAVIWATGSSFARDLLGSEVKGFDPEAARLWNAGGYESPEDALLWYKAGFTPKTGMQWKQMKVPPMQAAQYKELNMEFKKAYSWYKAKVPVADIEEWEKYGYQPVDAGKWAKIGLKAHQTQIWVDNGIPPKKAAPWVKAGFIENPKVALSWEGSVLKKKEAYQAFQLGFKASDFKNWEEGSSLLFAAIARDNKMSIDSVINNFKAFRDTVDFELLKDGDVLKNDSTIRVTGSLFALLIDYVEPLKESTGIYSLIADSTVLLHMNFNKNVVPKSKMICYGKGLSFYNHSPASGDKIPLPSMQYVWGFTVTDETWGLLKYLQVTIQ